MHRCLRIGAMADQGRGNSPNPVAELESGAQIDRKAHGRKQVRSGWVASNESVRYTFQMMQFRRGIRRLWSLWILLLVSALLVSQGAGLHTHDFDHAYDSDGGVGFGPAAVDHSHTKGLHSSLDGSHSEHHSVVAFDYDATPVGIAEPHSLRLVVLALAVLFSIPAVLYAGLRYRRPDEISLPVGQFSLLPPSRAPPA